MSPTDNRDFTDEESTEAKRSPLEVARIREDEKIADHWRRVADSLTEPARKQLLDDLRDWDAGSMGTSFTSDPLNSYDV